MGSDILELIIEHKRQEVFRLKRQGVRETRYSSMPARGFRHALSHGPFPNIIAEVKRASPSKGIICEDFDPLKTAFFYEEAGAKAISVLTDERFFKGSPDYLYEIKGRVGPPCLRKDFIIDHIQLVESRSLGADAVLLIVACLEPAHLKELLEHAKELGLDALIEVHNERETEIAIEAGAEIIGINNRNLKDFSVSLDTTVRLFKMIPDDVIVVSESGISAVDDIRRLKMHNINGVLIGEAFMRHPELLRLFYKEIHS